ncbi:MAG: signal peptidase I [Pseudomonadota bacterium]
MTSMTNSGTASSSPMGVFWENVRTIFYALLLAMAIRFTVAQPFRIPSSSMVPTLEVGDYIVVTKWSYGYGRYSFAPLEGLLSRGRLFGRGPNRGDVVVVRPISEPGKDFIKRVIGMPGDHIQMRAGRLYINGVVAPRESLGFTSHENDETGVTEQIATYRETLPGNITHLIFERDGDDGPLDNTGVYTVPEGHYFMMGDNRDNSSDSRVQFRSMPGDWARHDNCDGYEECYVPLDNLVGPARFIVTSFNSTTQIYKPWTLITGFRGDRFLKPVR